MVAIIQPSLNVRKGFVSEERVEPIGHALGNVLTTEFALGAFGGCPITEADKTIGGQPPDVQVKTWRMAPFVGEGPDMMAADCGGDDPFVMSWRKKLFL